MRAARAAGAGRPDALLSVDLDALAGNWRRLAALAPAARCAGVLKADAYGLGMAPVARALWRAGCRDFFVAQPEEAIGLRAVLAEASIHVLHGLRPGAADAYLRHRLLPCLAEAEQVRAWAAAGRAAGRRLPAALQVDTGMTRLGLEPAELAALAGDAATLGGLQPVLLMSHLANADVPDDPANAAQRRAFEAAAAAFPGVPRSLANSAGILLGAAYHFELLRPGIALYGGRPQAGGENPMAPVVRLQARVLQLRELPQARAVGYGGTHVAAAGRRLATVAIGYADGYLRALGGVGRAVVAGHRVPVVGRVSMDMTTLDVGDLPAGTPLAVGDLVDLVGPALPLDEVAEAAGTIGYELLVRLGPRIVRHYRGG